MFTPPNRHRLPSELEVMPFILRAMEFTGLWGSPVQIFRFLAAFGWGTMIILFPKAVLGIGSNRFDEIAKGIGELFFEGNLFYGLLVRTNFLHYHIFVLCSLFAYSVCGYFLLVKVSALLLMIQYSSSTYRLVELRIRKMAESKEVTQSELVDIVELHRLAYRCSTLVEQICHLPLALAFLTCILYFCLTLFYLSHNIGFNLVNVMVLFGLTVLETFGYSYLGSKLTEQADEVGAAIYDLPWFEHSVELQRYYRLMLQRVQRPTEITGAKFFVVQLATFGSAVQMSYSYYLVLKDLFTMI
ncbi:hypothetical protein quinque_011918 [Culex quinquefasciatus]